MSYSDSVIQAESGGDPNAANSSSSAVGAGQFIAPTWLTMIRQHRPDLAQGRSDAELLAMRSDPDLSRQMVDAYAADNSAILAKNGLPVTSGTQYLAHFAGPQGAVKVLQADPGASAVDVLGQGVARANPFLQKMTAGDLVAWADRKMGGAGQVAAPRPQAPQGILSQPQTAQQAAPSAPGILNQEQGADPSAAFRNVLAQLSAQQQEQAPQMAQIQFAMPKGLSRARLLAALNQPLGA